MNHHLGLTADDHWLNVLSMDHVGGLGTWFRAQESGARWSNLSQEKWNPMEFHKSFSRYGATVTSLVPTQVFDIVREGFNCPERLRLIVVGGGALSDDLYRRARKLGWPILPSFGMSELASQVATATLDSLSSQIQRSPDLYLLSHIDARMGDNQTVFLKSPSLCSKIASLGATGWEFRHLESGSWYETEDRGDLIGNTLRPLGRKSDQIKVLGELVDLGALNLKFSAFLRAQNCSVDRTHIISLPDERRGSELVLVSSDFELAQLDKFSVEFNQLVMGFERIIRSEVIKEWPRSDLGKIQWSRVKDLLRKT